MRPDHDFHTPVVIHDLCGACWPDEDPRTYEPVMCAEHKLSLAGPDDARVTSHGFIVGSAECGEGNAAWCELLSRPKAPLVALVLFLLAGCASTQVLVIDRDAGSVCQAWTTLPIKNTILRCYDGTERILPAAVLPP